MAVSSRFFLLSIPVPAIGSAKVSRIFELTRKRVDFFFLVRSLCGEQHAVRAIRGAKVSTYFDFQAAVSTFVAKADLNLEAVNPVDSWRGAKVRGFLIEPRRRRNFFFGSFGRPTPFV